MAVQRPRGDPRALGDRQHRGGGVAALVDQLARGVQQPFPGADAITVIAAAASRSFHAGSARSTIAAASTPAGSVP